MGYGTDHAADEDVRFSYGLALEAARDLHALAAHIRTHGTDRQGLAPAARTDWTGPHRDRFDQWMSQERADTEAVAQGLESTAAAIARSWAQARGQQDRINRARYVQRELDADGWLENAWEWTWFGKEDDFGAPPEDPPVPQPPAFAPTRAPLYPEFENH